MNWGSQSVPIWVVKIGSSLITQDGRGINETLIEHWAKEVSTLRAKGVHVIIVSSGAVAQGMITLGLRQRPSSIARLQAVAAVGQMGLIHCYQAAFAKHGQQSAQILLTHDDLRARDRYLNARNTLINLLALGVIPIVNENDTVVTDEIRFGDNDTLAALVANLVNAHRLMILTDQRGVFDQDPRTSDAAKLIEESLASNPILDAVAGSGGKWGRGGMSSKVRAARIAARSGTDTFICAGGTEGILLASFNDQATGTWLRSDTPPIDARKQWLANLPIKGRIELDSGAAHVLRAQGRSLLAVGVRSVLGVFSQGDMVSCTDPEGQEVARGLTNYSSSELDQIKGRQSREIEGVLGYLVDEEVIHRDDLLPI
ncbi:MAG: glutamate 5-kinase [Pseudomonadales bacterium]